MQDWLIDLIVSNDVRVGLRVGREGDESFVYDSWIRSYSSATPNRHVKWPEYHRYQKQVVTRLLARSELIVLCDPDDPDHVLGYAVIEPTLERLTLHWIFIKYSFRKFKLSTWLIEHILKTFGDGRELCMSHISASRNKSQVYYFENLRDKYGFVYDPLTKEDAL